MIETNWEKDTELIWKYIDGACSSEEKNEFLNRREESAEFKSLYEENLAIHTAMSKVAAVKAPVNLIPDTLSKLTRKKAYSFQPKPLYIFITSLIILGILSVILPQSSSTPISLIPGLNEIQFPTFSFIAEVSRILTYLVPVFIAIPLFYVLDQNLGRKLNVSRVA